MLYSAAPATVSGKTARDSLQRTCAVRRNTYSRARGSWVFLRHLTQVKHMNTEKRIGPTDLQPRRRESGAEGSVSLHNEDVGAAFDEMAELLSIQGENVFRIRAYQRAAQIIRSLPRELAEMHGAKEFDALPGIGADLAEKIEEFLHTGRLNALEKLRRQVPQGVRELLKLPALGPVRVRALLTELKVHGIDDLRRVLAEGRLREVKGFGPGIHARLTQALAENQGAPIQQRVPFSVATQYATPLMKFLEALQGVRRVEIAGSYRRGRDTVGDLDVLVSAARA